MPSTKFPGPNYNRLIDEDPQIVKVKGASAEAQGYEWGSRPSAMPKDTKNSMTIRHVGKEK